MECPGGRRLFRPHDSFASFGALEMFFFVPSYKAICIGIIWENDQLWDLLSILLKRAPFLDGKLMENPLELAVLLYLFSQTLQYPSDWLTILGYDTI